MISFVAGQGLFHVYLVTPDLKKEPRHINTSRSVRYYVNWSCKSNIYREWGTQLYGVFFLVTLVDFNVSSDLLTSE